MDDDWNSVFDDDDRSEEEDRDREQYEIDNDPYSDDEKDQMGSSEYFNNYD